MRTGERIGTAIFHNPSGPIHTVVYEWCSCRLAQLGGPGGESSSFMWEPRVVNFHKAGERSPREQGLNLAQLEGRKMHENPLLFSICF